MNQFDGAEMATPDTMEQIKKDCNPGCKHCYGTGFMGTQLHADGSRTRLGCRCVSKTRAKRAAAMKHSGRLDSISADVVKSAPEGTLAV